eukprot:gene40385-49943_t
MLPYKDYRTTLFNLTDDGEALKEFFGIIDEHRESILQFVEASALDNLGTYELIESNMESLYLKALELMNDTHITDSITYSLCIPSHLAVPTIHHNITRLKVSEIFRVYRPDPVYALAKTKYVSNWGGVIVDDAIRSHITTGNIVRVMFTKYPQFQPTPEEIAARTGWLWSGVIYCRILAQLSATHCLACVENKYCSEYEDIVLIIHVGAVSEVPFSWPGNENLDATGLEATSGEGFGCTGLGAAVSDGEVEVLYALYYDTLWAKQRGETVDDKTSDTVGGDECKSEGQIEGENEESSRDEEAEGENEGESDGFAR